MSANAKRRVLFLSLAAVLALIVLLLDVAMPASWAVGVLYALVVLIASRSKAEADALGAAILCSLLVLGRWLFTVTAADAEVSLVNAALALFAIWLTESIRTQAIRAQAALRSSEANVRAIVETAADGIVTITERGTVQSVNAACQRLFGYGAREMIGEDFGRFVMLPDEQGNATPFESEVHTGQRLIIGIRNELVARRKNGSVFPVSVSLSKVHLEGQGVVTAILHDLSELRRVSESLRHSEARMRTLVESAVDGIITIDVRGVIQSANPACERLFGYPVGEMVGRNVSLIMPSPEREEHDRYLQEYLQTGVRKILGIGREVAGRRRNGDVFPMYLAVSEVGRGAGRTFIGIVHDISDLKRAEEAQRFYASQLETRNAELLRSNRELDDFAYIAAHDLREPLRGIYNYSRFLLEDCRETLGDEGRRMIDSIHRLVRHMEELIDSLHEYSRVGRMDLAMQEVHLQVLVDEALDSLRPSLSERGVEVRVRGPLPTIVCDRVRLAEAVRNLVSNGAKYNDKPDKWIEIGVTDSLPAKLADGSSESSTGAEVILFVRDNGIGIDPRFHGTIFRIFKRLHTRGAFGGGTGAGLTIVQKIVERHGGRILLESVPEVGTTFYCVLPQKPA